MLEKLLESTDDFVDGFEAGQMDLLMYMIKNCSDEFRQEIMELQVKYNKDCMKALIASKSIMDEAV